MSNGPILFEEIFEVKSVNPDGKAFDKVTRFAATSVTYGMDMLIDINTDVYPLKANDRFTLVFANTLYKDNRPDPGTYVDYSKEKTLMDDYEYCMYGKVFKYQFKDNGNILIYISFGGLLLSLEGEQKHIDQIKYGDRVYCLIRRIQ
ncbi:DNA-directed RNA polymerase I, II, and III subunit rpabc3 [Blastocystis sp. ATCC 50177/Nand II]|uniref:DNA-directed RNA polymerases I, II, and III subunit RPABC3 n=1 Tax=Blastocystis sp. subtype 1 (strain ATCC 50177 / NandII) TaxID=478820 RepID=A0A196SNL7_BLAHN|nr:DNA-directed RNA polymerase I, II, and III subunit rpabc3 [Blastocystis sp. ATCC 50177/Nand II]